MNMFTSRGVVVGAAEAKFGMLDIIKAPAARNKVTVDPIEV